MESFLSLAAREIFRETSIPLEEKIIVLPNKRAGIFLSKALVEEAGKPVLSPEIITIQDFIYKHSPWQKIEWLDLVFEFYQAYTDYFKNNKHNGEIKTFDEFIKWAPVVLKDFEELDRFLLSPESVFKYIADAKVLEKWNLENSDSRFIKEYKEYYISLGSLYEKLKERLYNRKQVYGGLSDRYLAENIENYISKYKENQIFFAGFNALTKAEEKIIHTLVDANKAQIFWDADTYYLQEGFEAGKFLRKQKRKRKEFQWIFEDYTHKKNIQIIETNGPNAQINVLGHIMETQVINPDKTAVILNENSLLFPLLNNLPNKIDSFNITLGIPVSDTPLIQIFHLLNRLLLDREVYNKYKTEHLIEWFQSPLIAEQIEKNNPEQIDRIVRKIINLNTKFIAPGIINDLCSEYGGFSCKIFKRNSQPNKVLKLYKEVLEEFLERNLNPTDKIALQKLDTVIDSIIEFQDSSKVIQSFKTLELIFKKLLAKEQIYFEGEPLEGLQVMGLLETRLLDFEHIIMLGVNEGILPKGKNEQSIIPFDIKIDLGLPTHRDQNAIMAYYFYRSIQRAKNISLLYNGKEKGLSSGELSRFALQLINELPQYNSETKISKLSYSPEAGTLEENKIIEKNDYILKKLHSKAKNHGFSPTTLSRYINDPVDFLKKDILKLEEEEEIMEGISAKDIGTIIHDTLEELYTPYLQSFLTEENIKTIREKYKKIAKKHLDKKISLLKDLDGKKHIAFQVILKNINDIISIDEKLIREKKTIELLALESKFTSTLDIRNISVQILGKLDRIDKVNGQLRIIDYKTGNIKPENLRLNKIKDEKDFTVLLEKPELNKVFQLLLYSWLYNNQNEDFIPLTAGIISSRKYHSGIHSLFINKQNLLDEEILKNFEKVLISLLEEILNPEIDFIKK